MLCTFRGVSDRVTLNFRDLSFFHTMNNSAREHITGRLQLELDQHNTVLESNEARPRNTALSYGRKQEEFTSWMESMHFPDGITVTGAKVHSFLR
jgi:hypothetical protein